MGAHLRTSDPRVQPEPTLRSHAVATTGCPAIAPRAARSLFEAGEAPKSHLRGEGLHGPEAFESRPCANAQVPGSDASELLPKSPTRFPQGVETPSEKDEPAEALVPIRPRDGTHLPENRAAFRLPEPRAREQIAPPHTQADLPLPRPYELRGEDPRLCFPTGSARP